MDALAVVLEGERNELSAQSDRGADERSVGRGRWKGA